LIRKYLVFDAARTEPFCHYLYFHLIFLDLDLKYGVWCLFGFCLEISPQRSIWM
jgi:hypothetical protein